MKKYLLLLTILVSIVGWSGNGFSQCPSNNLGIAKPAVAILNTKNHPVLGNGTFFAVDIFTYGYPGSLMNGLERINAQNIDNSQFDGDVLELGLTPNVRNLTPDFGGAEEFKGQSGTYEVEIWRSTSVQPPLQPLPQPCPFPPNCPPAPIPYTPPFICSTDPIDSGLIPLPVPKNLKVSFKSGATTPTLSFDPVFGFLSEGPEGSQWYEIRIYDKNYTRRIYAVKIGIGFCGSSNNSPLPCSAPGSNPSVTYDDYRSINQQTLEELVPGEEYIFRADLDKELRPVGSTLCSSPQCTMIQSLNFKRFKVPKK